MAAAGDTLPFSPFEWMLALRYLRPRRKEGFISVIAIFSFLGIMLGVATLIIVMAVMNGFRAELYEKILGINGHMIVTKIGERFTDYDDVARRMAEVPGVKAAMPLIEGLVMMSSQTGAEGVYTRGMRASDITQLKLVADNLRGGTLENWDANEGVALGLRLAAKLGVNVGDMVTLVNPKGKATVFGVKPTIKSYPVVALFEIGMSEYDQTVAFMPLEEAQRYFNNPGGVSVLEVLVEDPEKVDQMLGPLQQAGGPSVFISDWRQRDATFLTVLDVERNVMFIILSLIVLVAMFNIISGLMMLVKDKAHDIAILRTMGATKGAVMRVFLITGASIGVVGTIAGFLLGLVFLRYIEQIRQAVSWLTGTTLFDPTVYYLSRLPAKMDPYETGAIVLMALILSVVSTLYPSWRASRLDPVKALRYE
jgi:lipoprotein-releasing system permease protein